MHGGGAGQRGLNLVHAVQEDGSTRTVNIGAKRTLAVRVGDRVEVLTPGGGGWGSPGSDAAAAAAVAAVWRRDGPPAPPLKAGGSLATYGAAQESV